MTGDGPGRSRTAVVAIGGNALSPAGEPASVANQFAHTRESLVPIVELAREGWHLAIVHGNGPQVGDELLRNECARDEVAPLPLGVLVASTGGWIGYMIQQSLENALERAGTERRVVTVMTQVLVRRDDPALERPTKFVGRPIRSADGGELTGPWMAAERDTGGRLRRRVSSPSPVRIVEEEVVSELVARGVLVVAAGGGGIPVYRDPELGLEGLDVVVDKDRAAALLASAIGAELLVILTDVDGVYEGYGTSDARKIGRIGLPGARRLLESGELEAGSMRPKVEAAVRFLEEGGQRAVISALKDGASAVEGREGTQIVADEDPSTGSR